MKARLVGAVCACMSVVVIPPTNAALIDAGNGTIFDSDLNIYWLQNASFAATNTFGVTGINADGEMTWDTANEWIDAMNASDGGNGYLGYTDWRLPTTTLPDSGCAISEGTLTGSYGFYCTGSEMGHLFYDELQGAAGQSILASGDTTELGKFSNVRAGGYWSGLEFDANNAWDFKFSNGNQVWNHKSNNPFSAWAVRDGSASAVPLPPALYLFGSGLLGLMGMARRRVQA